MHGKSRGSLRAALFVNPRFDGGGASQTSLSSPCLPSGVPYFAFVHWVRTLADVLRLRVGEGGDMLESKRGHACEHVEHRNWPKTPEAPSHVFNSSMHLRKSAEGGKTFLLTANCAHMHLGAISRGAYGSERGGWTSLPHKPADSYVGSVKCRRRAASSGSWQIPVPERKHHDGKCTMKERFEHSANASPFELSGAGQPADVSLLSSLLPPRWKKSLADVMPLWDQRSERGGCGRAAVVEEDEEDIEVEPNLKQPKTPPSPTSTHRCPFASTFVQLIHRPDHTYSFLAGCLPDGGGFHPWADTLERREGDQLGKGGVTAETTFTELVQADGVRVDGTIETAAEARINHVGEGQ
ncbi:hypothetical protein BDK51DRAFT_36935 [Blyttiomyces helicus]|uniref:Uncharacterized protein n=1 Tax=Blyttiomyces helicus TaxID=388810 RepID=A0A4P9W752_9FUNG|nr:hypothetical protein BDK51DRAFT_36935 [Blyttiomyces helicus]|eukprot:RKO86838.1 hypothetical protein BDK51DRAFT_36935 [Blyttiomyces helicus]